MPGRLNTAVLLTACLLIGGAVYWLAEAGGADWSEDELGTIESLSLGNLGEVPADPTNEVADDPAAAALGHRLFFDPRLSRDGSVSCATCHKPESYFTDDLTVGIGAGVGCDGQVLVLPDMLGITQDFSPRFLRRYLDMGQQMHDAIGQYVSDVRSKDFPNESEQY